MRLRPPIFILSLFLTLALATGYDAAQAGVCGRALSKLGQVIAWPIEAPIRFYSKLELQFAQRRLDKARMELDRPEVRGNPTLALISALEIRRSERILGREFDRGEKDLLRDAITFLRVSAFLEQGIKGKTSRAHLRHIGLAARHWVGDLTTFWLWMMGPNFYRALGVTGYWLNKPLSVAITQAQIADSLPAEYRTGAIATFDRVAQGRGLALYRKSLNFARRFGPSLLGIFLALNGIHPGQTLGKDDDRSNPGAEIARYLIEDPRFDPTDKDISIIVDDDLIREAHMFTRPGDIAKYVSAPLLTNPDLQFPRALAKTVKMKSVTSPEDFKVALLESTNRQMIFINAHGQPGDLNIGGASLSRYFKYLSDVKLSPQTVFVFISCRFADRSCRGIPIGQETIVRFTEQLVPEGGMAAGSLNISTFYPAPLKFTEAKSAEAQKAIADSRARIKFSSLEANVLTAALSLAAGQGVQALLNIYQSHSATSFGKIKGIRIYDQDAHAAAVTELPTDPRYNLVAADYSTRLANILAADVPDESKRDEMLKEWGRAYKAELLKIEAGKLHLPITASPAGGIKD